MTVVHAVNFPLKTGCKVGELPNRVIVPSALNKSQIYCCADHTSLLLFASFGPELSCQARNSNGLASPGSLSRLPINGSMARMVPSAWHKTRYHHGELFVEGECNSTSPHLVLLELCLGNDAAANYLHQGSLGMAISILTTTSQKLRQISNSDQSQLHNQRRTFEEIIPGSSRLPSFVEVSLCASSTYHMFTNAIRLRNSGYLANFSTLAAVVHFNLALARHIQAVQSYERSGSVAEGILKVASSYYKSSISRPSEVPAIIQAAAFCNLSECCPNDPTQSKHYRERYAEAFSDLDSKEERTIFTNNVSSVAVAA